MKFKWTPAMFALLLAACGSETDTTPDQTGTQPPADTSPPVATVLVDEDGYFDPVDILKVQFDEALDPASVPEHVSLTNLGNGDELFLVTAYSEADYSLVLTPTRPLPEDAAFALNLDGIADEAGNAIGVSAGALVGSAKTSMAVPLPVIIKSRPYMRATSLVYNAETGEVNHAWRYTYNETGKVWRVAERLSGPGSDGEWLDGNDETQLMFVDEMLTGNSYTRTWYEGPGGNGIWDAGLDDEIKDISLYNDPGLAGQESYVTSSGPGMDGEWFTPDDVYTLVHLRYFDSATRQLTYIFGNKSTENLGPGDDQEWFTADDRIEYYTVTQYDEKLRPVRTDHFRAGSDGLWFTELDQLYKRSETTLDDQGRIHTIVGSYLKTYTDTELTPNPSYVRYEYEGDSRWYLHRVNMDIGQDGAPGGGDDVVTGYLLFERDANGQVIRNGVFGGFGGADGIWFNDDDSSSNLSKYIRNEENQLVEHWNYDTTGMDNLRFTEDDRVDSLTRYERDAKGRLVRSYYYTEAGDDGDWDTSDDVIVFDDTYYTGSINNGN